MAPRLYRGPERNTGRAGWLGWDVSGSERRVRESESRSNAPYRGLRTLRGGRGGLRGGGHVEAHVGAFWMCYALRAPHVRTRPCVPPSPHSLSPVPSPEAATASNGPTAVMLRRTPRPLFYFSYPRVADPAPPRRPRARPPRLPRRHSGPLVRRSRLASSPPAAARLCQPHLSSRSARSGQAPRVVPLGMGPWAWALRYGPLAVL